MIQVTKLLPYLGAASVSSWLSMKTVKQKEKRIQASNESNESNEANESNESDLIKVDEIDFDSLYKFDESKHMAPGEEVNDSAQWALSYNEIWRRLSVSSNRFPVRRGRVSYCTVNSFAANDPIEDSYAIRPKLNTLGLSGMLFGVFDGHSGTNCSHFCRDELFDFIEYTAATSKGEGDTLQGVEGSDATGESTPDRSRTRRSWFGSSTPAKEKAASDTKTVSFYEKYKYQMNDRQQCRLVNADMNNDNVSEFGKEVGKEVGREGAQSDRSSHRIAETFSKRKMLPFTKSFLLADATFLTSMQHSNIYNGMTGACAVVCHVEGDWITTAWVGDCRALVGKCVFDPVKKKNVWKCVPLTQDHQIDMHSGERNRLLKEHPNEPEIIKRNRVKGRLQPTRVFGDGHYKRMEFFLNWKNAGKYTCWTPPYVTAQPELTSYELQDEDKFIIMACDGLFQDLQNDEVISAVGKLYDTGKLEELNPSTQLIWNALLAAGRSMQGRLNTEELNLSTIMNLPSHVKRRVHDDVTVVFISLSDKGEAALNNKSDQETRQREPKAPPRLVSLLDQKIVSRL